MRNRSSISSLLSRSIEKDEPIRLRATHNGSRDDWSLFTGRPLDPLHLEGFRNGLEGKRVLITGAGGYIGSALARALAQFNLSELLLVDIGELGLHQLACDLHARNVAAATRFVVGDVNDSALVHELFTSHQPQIVFHAAACKHVPLMETNPFTAASVNVLGTQRIVEAAASVRTQQCILLSTDKAVDPRSIMGATKRIAERIILGHSGETRMKALRLGNVLGSSGSVAPLFLQQIRDGGPVTVTDPQAKRFFLSVDEALHSLLSASAIDTNSTILVAAVGEPHPITDLAKFLIAREAPTPNDIRIVFTGLRPGDKVSERMTSANEFLTHEPVTGLHLVQSSATSELDLDPSLRAIAHAVHTRDLPLLLQTIQTAVPEYRPSDLLEQALARAAPVHSA